MILHDVWNVEVGFSAELPIEIEPVQEHLSTDLQNDCGPLARR